MLNVIPDDPEEKIIFEEMEWQYIFDFSTAEYTIFLKNKNRIIKKTISQGAMMELPTMEKFYQYNPFTWYNVSETILR